MDRGYVKLSSKFYLPVKVMTWTWTSISAACTVTLRQGHGQQLCQILSRSNMAVRSSDQDTYFSYVCTDIGLRSQHNIQIQHGRINGLVDKDFGYMWSCRYDVGSRSWHYLGCCTTIMWRKNKLLKYVKWTRSNNTESCDKNFDEQKKRNFVIIYNKASSVAFDINLYIHVLVNITLMG